MVGVLVDQCCYSRGAVRIEIFLKGLIGNCFIVILQCNNKEDGCYKNRTFYRQTK
jgi:hypothetical protein